MQPPLPLDYPETLAILDSWASKQVLVVAHSQAPGEPMSHTQVTLTGALGNIQMVDNAH